MDLVKCNLRIVPKRNTMIAFAGSNLETLLYNESDQKFFIGDEYMLIQKGNLPVTLVCTLGDREIGAWPIVAGLKPIHLDFVREWVKKPVNECEIPADWAGGDCLTCYFCEKEEVKSEVTGGKDRFEYLMEHLSKMLGQGRGDTMLTPRDLYHVMIVADNAYKESVLKEQEQQGKFHKDTQQS